MKMICINEIEFSKERRSGNSTRQIDLAVGYLFKGYTVKVEDHLSSEANGHSDDINRILAKRIINRLKFEHHVNDDQIVFDDRKITLRLANSL